MIKLVVDKSKVYKGFSYFMKTSYLIDPLETIGFNGFIHLIYWIPQLDNITHCSLIQAWYWLANPNVDYNRFYIRTGVVQSHRRKDLEMIAKEQVIPQLVDWMLEVDRLPDNATFKEGRTFMASYINNELKINS